MSRLRPDCNCRLFGPYMPAQKAAARSGTVVWNNETNREFPATGGPAGAYTEGSRLGWESIDPFWGHLKPHATGVIANMPIEFAGAQAPIQNAAISRGSC